MGDNFAVQSWLAEFKSIGSTGQVEARKGCEVSCEMDALIVFHIQIWLPKVILYVSQGLNWKGPKAVELSEMWEMKAAEWTVMLAF